MSNMDCAHCRHALLEPDTADNDGATCNGCFERELARGPLWFECRVWGRTLLPYANALRTRYREEALVEAAHERVLARWKLIKKARQDRLRMVA